MPYDYLTQNKFSQIYQAITVHIAMYYMHIAMYIRIAAKFQYNLPIISVDIPPLRN